MSLDIDNILGNSSEGLSSKVKSYFDNAQSPAPAALAQLNELIGFPYRLKIDWQTIREDIALDILDDAKLVELVCSSTDNLFKVLLHLLEEDEDFSEVFIEKTKSRGRTISVRLHYIAEKPFTRINEDALYPTLELYLPRVGKPTNVSDISASCGQDLSVSVSGTSPLDPINNYKEEELKAFLPKVKDLPRPALALSHGPIYIRLMETISDGQKETFDVEGYPPVIELISEYINKHANNRYAMSFTHWTRAHRLGQGVGILRVMDSDTQTCMSPLFIVGLLEGSLGFTRVGEPVGVGSKLVWLFKREKAFLQL